MQITKFKKNKSGKSISGKVRARSPEPYSHFVPFSMLEKFIGQIIFNPKDAVGWKLHIYAVGG